MTRSMLFVGIAVVVGAPGPAARAGGPHDGGQQDAK
jgi:hypothetical protein